MSVYDWEQARGKRRRAVRPSPLFLIVLGLTLVGAVAAWLVDGQGSRVGDFGVFVFVLAGWILSVCLHEFAHAYAAYRAGDRSVEAAGYLTLNPFKYAHPVLSLGLPLLAIIAGGFGLPGGAVYLHPHTFRTRLQRSLAAASGPLVNLVLGAALVALASSHGLDLFTSAEAAYADHLRFWSAIAFLGFLQLTAAVLNFLPIPGLDGWAIIEPYLSPETQRVGTKIAPWGMLAVIVLLFYSDSLRNAFFDLVTWIYELFGGQEIMWSLGSQFFKFWSKQPF